MEISSGTVTSPRMATLQHQTISSPLHKLTRSILFVFNHKGISYCIEDVAYYNNYHHLASLKVYDIRGQL